ncbi:MAG: DUF1858 domain-containing protein [Bacteroidetes bacterium]|nr:DUF1858 domain-containing protein [Bacteroidota bacterium]
MGGCLIERTTPIEELVALLPDAVGYMMRAGIKCIACGEPVWGTIESAAQEKGLPQERIDRIVADLNAMLPSGAPEGTGCR